MVPVRGRLLEMHTAERLSNDFKPGRKTVAFSYRFGQRHYVGNTATFCAAVTTASQIDPLHDMYAQLASLVGKTVTVWVDPAKPEHAVLFKYVPRGAMLALGGGLFFLVLGLFKLDRWQVAVCFE